MKIRLKSLIALLATTICLLIIIHFISAVTIEDNFSKIEENEVTQTIMQLHIAATRRYIELDGKLADWSQKNETYEFIRSQKQNSSNHETLISVDAMRNIGVNYALLLDENGVYITGFGLNLTTLQVISVPEELLTKVSEKDIWDLKSIDATTNGFIEINDQPMLLASRPILTSEGNGPVRGVLIFARYFDKEEITQLSYLLRLPLTIQSFSDWKTNNPIQTTPLAASYVKPLSQQSIAGYDIINDINGQPAFVLGAVSLRTVYSQGLRTISYIDQALILSGIIFSFIIVLILEGSVLNRLSKLTNAMLKLGASDKQSRMLPVSGNDEITWLTQSINKLLNEIHLQSLKLQKNERLSAIGELARQVGHDLRNPLTSSNNAVYYLKKKGGACTERERETMLGIIENDIKRADKTITNLVDYSSEIFVNPQKCSTKELLTVTLAHIAIPDRICIIDETSDKHSFYVDKEEIKKVFLALIKNAVEAISNEGTIKIESTQGQSTIQINFIDTGTGIPEKLVPKIFTPLVTTKAQGIGFSLAICKRIIEAHGGTINLESQFGKGSTFTITLPIQPKKNPKIQDAVLSRQDPLLHYDLIDEASSKDNNVF
jgi:signal transduction histidine kinase